MTDFFRIGIYTNTHGIKGEIKVLPTTDYPDRFKSLRDVVLKKDDKEVKLTARSARFFKNMVILSFEGIDNINDIEYLKGAELYVARENAVPLSENEFYVADVIGADVVTESGERIGELTDILKMPANDVYVIKLTDGREVYFPGIKECIKDVSPEEHTVTVNVMKGLID